MSTRQRRPRRRRPTSFIPEGLCLEERCLLSINLTMNPIGTQQEGVPIGSQVLASFTFDSGTLTDYSAEITWGDGTAAIGQIAADFGGGGTISSRNMGSIPPATTTPTGAGWARSGSSTPPRTRISSCPMATSTAGTTA